MNIDIFRADIFFAGGSRESSLYNAEILSSFFKQRIVQTSLENRILCRISHYTSKGRNVLATRVRTLHVEEFRE